MTPSQLKKLLKGITLEQAHQFLNNYQVTPIAEEKIDEDDISDYFGGCNECCPECMEPNCPDRNAPGADNQWYMEE